MLAALSLQSFLVMQALMDCGSAAMEMLVSQIVTENSREGGKHAKAASNSKIVSGQSQCNDQACSVFDTGKTMSELSSFKCS